MTPKKVVADTNIFLRFLLHDIPTQYIEAQKLFNKAKEKKIDLLVPQIIIFEIAYALDKYYNFPKYEVIDKLKSLLSSEYFNIQNRDLFQLMLDSYKEGNLELVDYFIFYFAKAEKAELFTFDKNLKKLK